MWMYFWACTSVHVWMCECVWGEWRAACPCLVWRGFTRPLGSGELDSLTAWTGRREREREGEEEEERGLEERWRDFKGQTCSGTYT